MQNKLYTIQFSHHPMTDSQPVPEQKWRNLELADFVNFMEPPKKTELPERFILTEKRGINKGRFLSPCPTPIYKLSMTSMVWNISIGQLGCLSRCAASQLLHTCSSAEYGRMQKILDFLATTETISVINIILVLNPKHSSYWEENYPS